MKGCTKRWPPILVIQILWAGIAKVLFPHTESVLHSLASRTAWSWKLTKISETGDEPQPSKKHRHEVPPQFSDAGKTKGALGFVVLAFFCQCFFCWRGYSIHLLHLITFYTVYTHHLIHDWHSVFKGNWIYSRCVICGPHIQWPPVIRRKMLELPMLTFPKDVF